MGINFNTRDMWGGLAEGMGAPVIMWVLFLIPVMCVGLAMCRCVPEIVLVLILIPVLLRWVCNDWVCVSK